MIYYSYPLAVKHAELQQVLQELGMKNIICNMDSQGPDEELFTVGIRNLVLHSALPSLFGSPVTTLAPHIGQAISEATHTLVDLEEIEMSTEGSTGYY